MKRSTAKAVAGRAAETGPARLVRIPDAPSRFRCPWADPRWKLSGQWLVARLIGDAAQSPVTLSRTQNTFTLTLWYQVR
ncbi:hypothetical protein [Variovorax sp. YR216]|uniref:hypothetical protein n=1 Tax=Variovorax sp. YR216 TaxID=1882828 RepID=UPI00115F88A3|nr:hypothetical protein [Variovorax sp. YR216]